MYCKNSIFAPIKKKIWVLGKEGSDVKYLVIRRLCVMWLAWFCKMTPNRYRLNVYHPSVFR